MRKIALLSLLIFAFSLSHAQEKQPKKGSQTTTSEKTPEGNWTVTKKYDQDGNLIAKDSVYSHSYSSINGHEVSPEELDSLRQQMHMYLGSSDLPRGFDLDSIQKSFFGSNFGDDMGGMNEIHKRIQEQMEAFHNQFFSNMGNHGKQIPKENKKENKSRESKSSQPGTQI